MTAIKAVKLDGLYESDETAWLEAMSTLAGARRFAEMDTRNLSEYLAAMAKRDRREVLSRLIVLLTHLIKWECQQDRRTGSWRATIREQRRQLREILESGTLRNHAAAVLLGAYDAARRLAADETELDVDTFPVDNPWGLDEIVGTES